MELKTCINFAVAVCCLEKQISSHCASACVFDVDITAIQLKRLQCIPELPKMVDCSAGRVDFLAASLIRGKRSRIFMLLL